MNKKQLDFLIGYINIRTPGKENTTSRFYQEQLYKMVEEVEEQNISESSIREAEKQLRDMVEEDPQPDPSPKVQESLQEVNRKLRDINTRLDLLSEQYRDLNNWLKERLRITSNGSNGNNIL